MSASPAELDACDPLAQFASQFHKPPGQLYLDGNSLGLLCRPAEAALARAVDAWRERAILGWTAGPEPWFELSRQVAARLAPILGAEPADVMVGQSTTVNLHQLLATFWNPSRPRVLIDAHAFPSDRYAVTSHLRLRGRDPIVDLVVAPARDELLAESDLLAALDESVGLAVLPAVVYRSGQLLDSPSITRAATGRGVRIVWDCSHSAGVVPHRFRADEIELAIGCTYKYLNGGPGSVGWLYVHPELRDRTPGLAGWFGSDPARQFDMAPDFTPADDASRFLIGTPHVLSLAPLLGALELIEAASVSAIRAKSLAQTEYLIQAADRLGLEVVTPRREPERGGHVTLRHPDAGPISRALRARGVIPDYRPPDLLRFAPAPLYTSFADCAAAMDRLEEILTTGTHEQFRDRHDLVT